MHDVLKIFVAALLLGCGPSMDDLERQVATEADRLFPVYAACGNIDAVCDSAKLSSSYSLYIYNCDRNITPAGRDAVECFALAPDCESVRACGAAFGVTEITKDFPL